MVWKLEHIPRGPNEKADALAAVPHQDRRIISLLDDSNSLLPELRRTLE